MIKVPQITEVEFSNEEFVARCTNTNGVPKTLPKYQIGQLVSAKHAEYAVVRDPDANYRPAQIIGMVPTEKAGWLYTIVAPNWHGLFTISHVSEADCKDLVVSIQK